MEARISANCKQSGLGIFFLGIRDLALSLPLLLPLLSRPPQARHGTFLQEIAIQAVDPEDGSHACSCER